MSDIVSNTWDGPKQEDDQLDAHAVRVFNELFTLTNEAKSATDSDSGSMRQAKSATDASSRSPRLRSDRIEQSDKRNEPNTRESVEKAQLPNFEDPLFELPKPIDKSRLTSKSIDGGVTIGHDETGKVHSITTKSGEQWSTLGDGHMWQLDNYQQHPDTHPFRFFGEVTWKKDGLHMTGSAGDKLGCTYIDDSMKAFEGKPFLAAAQEVRAMDLLKSLASTTHWKEIAPSGFITRDSLAKMEKDLKASDHVVHDVLERRLGLQELAKHFDLIASSPKGISIQDVNRHSDKLRQKLLVETLPGGKTDLDMATCLEVCMGMEHWTWDTKKLQTELTKLNSLLEGRTEYRLNVAKLTAAELEKQANQFIFNTAHVDVVNAAGERVFRVGIGRRGFC